MDTFEEIDDKISALELELLVLRQKRNTLTALRRMPNEILARIFITTQGTRSWKPDSYLTNDSADILDDHPGHDHTWMNLMSSCTFLREAALNTHELWQTIQYPCHTKWRGLCLQRARGTAPILYVDGGANSELEFEDQHHVIVAQLPRAIEACILKLTSGHEQGSSEMKSSVDVLNRACVYLQHLTLKDSGWVLTSSFLGGQSTALTSLVISISRLESWSALPNLRYLSVTFTENPGSFAERKNLLQWLNASHNMEVLALEYSTTDLHPQSPNIEGNFAILMPSLRFLRFHAPIRHCAALLQALPDPKIGLDITIRPVHTWSDVPESNYAPHEAVYQHVTHFWHTHSEDQPAPQLESTVFFSEDYRRGRVILKSSSRLDDLRAYCSYAAPYFTKTPALYTIKTLHFVGGRVGPMISSNDYDPYELSLLDLDCVIAEQLTHRPYAVGFGKWLKERRNKNRPIRLVQIRGEAANYLRSLLEHLKIREVIQAFQ
jgi:hypothetical protein